MSIIKTSSDEQIAGLLASFSDLSKDELSEDFDEDYIAQRSDDDCKLIEDLRPKQPRASNI